MLTNSVLPGSPKILPYLADLLCIRDASGCKWRFMASFFYSLSRSLYQLNWIPFQISEKHCTCINIWCTLTKVFHAFLVRLIQKEVALLDSAVHFKAESQTRILHQVCVDVMSQGLKHTCTHTHNHAVALFPCCWLRTPKRWMFNRQNVVGTNHCFSHCMAWAVWLQRHLIAQHENAFVLNYFQIHPEGARWTFSLSSGTKLCMYLCVYIKQMYSLANVGKILNQ